ncbi:MAG: hypothetical protein DWH78_02230 [Planctomycetota bacterium]|nr:MAG: hypothetical protein DWH78_02230 [Planctomycetota bacterium]
METSILSCDEPRFVFSALSVVKCDCIFDHGFQGWNRIMNVTRRPISNGNMALSSKETARRHLIRPWAQQPVAESNSANRSYPPTASTGKCENCESEMLPVDRLLAESRTQPINDERRVQQQERTLPGTTNAHNRHIHQIIRNRNGRLFRNC